MSNFDFICVGGYGKSGSGACVDLLKEFEAIDGPSREFRIAKDPSGLLDLELSIVDNWEFVRHNMAINDFLEYCLILSREDGIFKKKGMNFSSELNVDLMKESEKYVNELNDFMYIGDTVISRYHLNAVQSFKGRLRSKFGLSNKSLMSFSRPTEDKFLVETRKYLRSIFENYARNKKLSKVVLNQAISPVNIGKTLRYFDNAKLIIVDRDPRDIYTTMIRDRKLLMAEGLNNLENVNKYIKWFYAGRKQVSQDINYAYMKNRVMRLNYEDFYFNYEKTLEEIKEFLGLEIGFNHKDKGTGLQTEQVKKDIGIWKSLVDQDTISVIERELGEYCFRK